MEHYHSAEIPLKITSSVINVTEIEKHRVQYVTKQFRVESNSFEEKIGSHNVPQASNFDFRSLKQGHNYLLTSARIDGRWYFVVTNDIDNGTVTLDAPLLKYLKTNILGVR